MDSTEAKTTGLRTPITLEAFSSQDGEITLLWSVTEIRGGCGMLKRLPQPSPSAWAPLEEHPSGAVTTGGGASRTLHHRQHVWVSQKESWSFASLCYTDLISAGAQPLTYLCKFISSAATPPRQSLPADARGDSAASLQHPCPYHALCVVGSEIRISGRRCEVAEVPQALLLK